MRVVLQAHELAVHFASQACNPQAVLKAGVVGPWVDPVRTAQLPEVMQALRVGRRRKVHTGSLRFDHHCFYLCTEAEVEQS